MNGEYDRNHENNASEKKRSGRITSVRKQKGKPAVYEVYIDDQPGVVVTEEMIVRHRILPGTIVHVDQCRQWEEECKKSLAYHAAIAWLAARPRTAKELERYLAHKGWDEDTIRETIDRCHEQGYIDDLKLAIAVIEHRMGRQKMGRLRVISELRQRGVNSEWIEEALRRFEENDEEEEWERAMAVARKKWASRYKNREEQKRRTGMYLLRRGFESELVIKILEKLENEM